MSDQPLDLLVIGGGPTGLSMANAALYRGAKRVRVIEQAQSFQKRGNFLNLANNGVLSLRALSPEVANFIPKYLLSNQTEPVVFQIFTTKGEQLSTFDAKASSHENMLVAWWQLQKELAQAIQDEAVILRNHRLVNLTHSDEDGLAHAVCQIDPDKNTDFREWQVVDNADDNVHQIESDKIQTVTLRAKLVVAADGINSTARRCIYRDTNQEWEKFSRPVYIGLLRVSAKGKPQLDPQCEATLKSFTPHDGMAFIVKPAGENYPDSIRAILASFSKPEAPFTYLLALYVTFTESELNTTPREELVTKTIEHIHKEGFPNAIIQLAKELWKHEVADRLTVRPMYAVPVCNPHPFDDLMNGVKPDYPEGFEHVWYHRRVVLAGDALHAVPPFYGQGTSIALEDVVCLADVLQESGIWDKDDDDIYDEQNLKKTFEKYKTQRIEKLKFMQKITVNRLDENDLEATREKKNKLREIW